MSNLIESMINENVQFSESKKVRKSDKKRVVKESKKKVKEALSKDNYQVVGTAFDMVVPSYADNIDRKFVDALFDACKKCGYELLSDEYGMDTYDLTDQYDIDDLRRGNVFHDGLSEDNYRVIGVPFDIAVPRDRSVLTPEFTSALFDACKKCGYELLSDEYGMDTYDLTDQYDLGNLMKYGIVTESKKKKVKEGIESNTREFMSYHENPHQYNISLDMFNAIYEILDKYGDEDDVEILFRRASEEDQQKILSLLRHQSLKRSFKFDESKNRKKVKESRERFTRPDSRMNVSQSSPIYDFVFPALCKMFDDLEVDSSIVCQFSEWQDLEDAAVELVLKYDEYMAENYDNVVTESKFKKKKVKEAVDGKDEVCIIIKGGMVQEVFSTRDDIDASVIDLDVEYDSDLYDDVIHRFNRIY